MAADKSEFEKVTASLMVSSVGNGFYPIEMVEGIFEPSGSSEAWDIMQKWTEKEEAMFLIYFGEACMKMLEEG